MSAADRIPPRFQAGPWFSTSKPVLSPDQQIRAQALQAAAILVGSWDERNYLVSDVEEVAHIFERYIRGEGEHDNG